MGSLVVILLKAKKAILFFLSIFLFTFSIIGSVVAVAPDVNDFFSGDAHIHTSESWDTRAAWDLATDPSDIAESAQRSALNWSFVTDHSDVVTREHILWGQLKIQDFLDQIRWQNQKQKIQAITDFPILQGEELTVGNG